MEILASMEFKHLLTREEKLEWWGDGEWVEEPDLCHFEHEGFHCHITRVALQEINGHMFGGYFCGYICIPQNHPWINMNWETIQEFPDIEIHGGLTYFGQKEDGEYWIGFDCAHLNDLTPSTEKLILKFGIAPSSCIFFSRTYRTIKYVIEHCKLLADQAKKASIPVSSSFCIEQSPDL